MRWTSSLLPRLLIPYLAALGAVAVSLYVYTDRAVERLYVDTLADTVLRQARGVGERLPWDERGAPLDAQCAALAAEAGARITVIAADGTVLGDSDAPSTNLENHSNRPEVRDALRGGDGRDTRTSASVRRPLFYRAWRQERGGEHRVIRLAVPMVTIERTRARVRAAIAAALLLAGLAALWPALAVSRRLARRVERLAAFSTAVRRGERPGPLGAERPDVIGRLEENVHELALSLSQQLHASREEKTKLEGVLAGMVEGVFVIDPGGTIVLSNRRAEALFDLPSGQSSVGRPLIEVTRHPDLHALVRDVMATPARATTTMREITLEGARPQVLQVSATPLLADDGSVQAFVLVCHDITEPKRIEQSRRDFVANVSHELRTPLAAIRGYSETLLTGALDDPPNARRFLSIIERHAERLGRLVDDLLTLSDLELGRAELQRAAVAVEPIVTAVFDVLRDKAAQAGVQLAVTVEPTTPLLDADPDRLEQALLNLVDNAIKYTPRGGHVRVLCGPSGEPPTAETGGGRQVELAVSDDGVGIPSKDLPRLTERFYRVDKARSRELGGTGLGLAIVKHIVQAHGGSLQIESELNRGTSIRLFLRAAAAEPSGAA